MAKKESQNPTTKEFAQRIIDNYIDINQELINDLVPFAGIDMKDHNTETEEAVREIFERNIKATVPMEQIFSLPARNMHYFQLFINIVNIILDMAGKNVISEKISTLPLDDTKDAPERTEVWKTKDGKIYKRSKGMRWTKTEKIFINVRLRKGKSPKEIYDEFQKSTLTHSRSKSSVSTMLYRLKKGKAKIN